MRAHFLRRHFKGKGLAELLERQAKSQASQTGLVARKLSGASGLEE